MNFTNSTIGGYPDDSNIGTIQLECVGVDDAFWETVIPFQLIVKPCYFKCKRCWDSEYNTCKSCNQDYFLLNSECLDSCVKGTYPDVPTLTCLQCPKPCTICTGPDPFQQCQACAVNYYKLENGCYSKCPDGYWGDKTDFTCKRCNFACNICFGPSSTQCYNCTELYQENEIGNLVKTGYALLGDTECKIPKCVDGYYFQWDPQLNAKGIATGQCEKCHQRCKKCVGPSQNECTFCYPGQRLIVENHYCIQCEEMKGLFTNEEYECEDICGDGIIIDKQCDDGNTASGDGCNNLCQIEYGFECLYANQSCRENIPPTFKIITITEKNVIYIQFSEYVKISSVEGLTDQNINVEIIGSKDSYSFSFRIINDPQNPLVPGRNIKKFALILEDMRQSLEGNENVKISFKNYTQIQDLAGNSLTLDSYQTINPYPYSYISPTEASTASSGGSSLKYTFISVFSFNIGLKIILNSSMQYLWGLVHALQVFNFLLYLNIDFPENITLFSGYLAVASGDIEEFNQFIPNMGEYLINEKDVVEPADDDKLYKKFKDNGISPYFILAFGQKLTLWALGFLLILPIAFVFNKLCKKVKLWDDVISSFFFNLPLRTFIEMYIELVLQAIINTQFIKYKNISAIITTSLAFVFGALSLLLPFITMTLIYHNRRRVRKHSWIKSFGMLTDELRQRSILQLYYYPLFMYQRLMIAGTIVYVTQYPLIQCFIVIACNLAMIAYLIIVRPFREESQQTTTVLDEFVIMVCVCLFIILYSKDLTQDDKKNYGWGIILLIMFSVCKNFGVVIYFGFKKARETLKKMFEAEDQLKESPNTSDNDSNDNDNDFDTDEIIEELKQGELKEVYQQIQEIKQRRLQLAQNNQLIST